MKKALILLLTGLLVLFSGVVLTVCGQESPDMLPVDEIETENVDAGESGSETVDNEEPANRIIYDYDSLVVVGPTPTTGNFFCSLWGNVTSDMDVRMLLHGYNLVEWETAEGMFIIDPTVVSGLVVTQDGLGNRTYTIAIYNDLYYSDGTRITARDYAFSMLLTMSNEAAEIGGSVKRPEYLLGYEEYITGEVPYLAGVRILADDQFSITVSADYLPFFYELGLLDCTPYPISEIAPGVVVADDGNGIYLANADGSQTRIFTADLLRETILNETTGYLTYPRVNSGPYTLVSYENGRAEFELNPYYKGDAHGMLPGIQHLSYYSLEGNAMIDAFAEGTVGLVNKVTNYETVQYGQQAVAANSQFTVANYPRTGLAFISFATERAGVNEFAVRRAIANLIDKDSFVANTVSGFGLRTDGYYGVGQWMYQLLTGTLEFPVEEPEGNDPAAEREYNEEIEAWESLSLDEIETYVYDPEEAAAQLSSAGWNLNAAGESYQPQTDSLRYKRIDGELVPLKLRLAYPEGSSMAPAMESLIGWLADGGIELEIEAIQMEELLSQYYANSEREFDMYFLASNFDALFDPSANFVVNDAGEHVWVATALADEDLYQYSVNMRKTEAGELLDYCREWLNFQVRFAETLPMIPLYSNVYFDYFPQELQNYDISSYLSWSQAVIPAYLSDVIEEVEETGEAEFGEDGLIEFND